MQSAFNNTFLSVIIKAAAVILSLVLIVCGIVSGTVAYIMARTAPVTNIFTYGDINITLTETDTGDGDDDPNTNEYNMSPGCVISKDPKITVMSGSEDSWLFVKLERSANFDDFMEYTVADGWTALEGAEGVYYRQVDRSTADTVYYVISGNTVTVKNSVTKEMLNSLDKDGVKNYPTLTLTAYAVQRDADIAAIDSAAKAWALVNG